MDSGFDSPVRTSSGHKAVPEDLDTLFDSPIGDQPAPPGAPAAQVTAETPVPAKPPVTPAAKSTPRATPAVKLDPPPSADPFPDLTEPAAESPPVIVERVDGSVVDLDRPAKDPVRTSHRSLVTVATVPPPRQRKSAILVLGGAAALSLAAAAVGWWMLSHRSAAGARAGGAQPSGDTVPVTALHPVTAESVSTGTPTTAKPVDSVAARPPREEVIAAARPNFKADVVLPPSDLSLGPVPGAGTAIPVSELVRRMSAGERQAAADLDGRLSGFRNLFVPSRLGNLDGVSQARSLWLSGAEAIRDYRARIARLEAAYEDSALASQRVKRWTGDDMRAWAAKTTLAEPGAMSQLADLMFSQVNEALEILAALDGQYSMAGKNIQFRNPASGTRYLSIRNWVEQRTQVWSSTPETARPRTISAMLVALGEGLPAVQ
jgi:hypothetical protein